MYKSSKIQKQKTNILKREHNLRIIPLGGFEEVGRNMMLFEYGQDILIIDMGLQFPEENMPGIDYIIPNIDYLRGKEKNIRGIIITHAHYDHIGAIPHLIGSLGNPPIFATSLTLGIIKKRQEDYPNNIKLNLIPIKETDKINLRSFNLEFFHVNHNIPGGFGIAIHTPVGLFIHTGDFKFDSTPVGDKPADIGKIARLSLEGVTALLSDSTEAETPGHSLSEKTIQDTLERIFEKSSGRIIATTFASLISRIQEIIFLAEKFGRKVIIDGYSMKTNVEIARNLGWLKIKKGTLIKLREAVNLPDSNIVIICTGAQGEDKAVLMRIVNKEHRYISLHRGDTVIFSSSVVPGNERTVQTVKDSIWRQDARVIHYKMMDVHAGGHAHQEDLKMMINLVRPRWLIPIHGNYYMRRLHGEIGKDLGIPSENIFIPDNGQVIEFSKKGGRVKREKVHSSYVMVDGLGVGDVGQVVLRDRQMMARDGMFTVVVIVDSKTGKLRGSPDIISRGFIYMKESQALLAETRREVEKIITQKTAKGQPANWVYVRNSIRDLIGEFLYKKTQRRPMVLPVVIEV